ncbi:MAG: DUF1552 domain-containing protein [Myxococcota bacterium]
MIPLRKPSLGRRAVLRGGSAFALSLPMLDMMLDDHGTALAGGGDIPKRFISWMFGNGVDLTQWEPTDVGPDYALSPALSELEPVKDYVTVCSGLAVGSAKFITHHEGMIAFSGYNYVERPDLGGIAASDWGGPTIDQVIAARIADEVALPVRSMQVGVSRHPSPADNGSAAETLSCRGEPDNLVPLPPEFQPRAVWENLFGEFVGGRDDKELRGSMLDLVKGDAERLRNQLGSRDQQRLDAHLDGVFELEQKIAALAPPCALPGEPSLVNDFPVGQEPLTELNQVMSDLVATAFACDVTRVASVLFLHMAGEVRMGDVGQFDTHHNPSHMMDEGYRAGVQYIYGRMSDLLQTLQATEDGGGKNLLDNTIVYATSDCAHGETHQYERMPVVLAGTGGGHLVYPGVHYQSVAAANPHGIGAPSAGNTSDVLLACLQAFDPDATEIGAEEAYSDAPLQAILA